MLREAGGASGTKFDHFSVRIAFQRVSPHLSPRRGQVTMPDKPVFASVPLQSRCLWATPIFITICAFVARAARGLSAVLALVAHATHGFTHGRVHLFVRAVRRDFLRGMPRSVHNGYTPQPPNI